jgi:hypothetical protein
MLLAFFLSAGCLTPSFEEAAVAQEWPGPPLCANAQGQCAQWGETIIFADGDAGSARTGEEGFISR